MTHELGQFDFNNRYGIKPVQVWKRYALICLLVGGGWLTWAGLHQANPELRYELISFDTDNPRAPEIRYLISRDDGDKEVLCTLTARDYEKNVVGQVEERIPAGERYLEISTVIPTRAIAVNAGITRCRIL